jgi:tetratricopeptide (TPR) repeat protein
MEKAYALDESDARVLLELDQLYKKIGKSPAKRLEFLEKHFDVVSFRDDLYLEYITLHNFAGNNEKAKSMLETRNFHPWEGGEGKVPAQYLLAHAELAKKAIKRGNFEKAAELMQKALGEYPHNLGEGKLYGAQENNLNYILGCAYEGMDLPDKAAECFEKAAVGLSEPAGMMFYNDQPPEMIYYQGLALMKLGRKDAAFSRFNKLIAYGKKHYYDEVRLDYFAVSFPDLMIFDEDLNVRNRLHCLFMMLLGHLGKGENDEALRCFEEIRQIDPNHAGMRFHADVDIFQ